MAVCRTNIGVKIDKYVRNSEPHEYGWGSKLKGLSKSCLHPKVRKSTKELSKFLGSRRPDRIEISSTWIKRVAVAMLYRRDRVMQDSSEAAKSAATNALSSANNSLISSLLNFINCPFYYSDRSYNGPFGCFKPPAHKMSSNLCSIIGS